MKAIIFPTTNTGDLAPLTSWIPEFLLPVVNKPIVEHLIELLVRHHIEEILLIVKHMPYETENYFGDGSRWGVRLSYSLLSSYRGITDALGRIEASKLEGSFLCLPADLVTDLDISDFINVQRQGQGDICLASTTIGPDQPKLQHATTEGLEAIDFYPLIMNGEAFKSFIKLGPHGVSPDVPNRLGREHDIVNTYCSPFNFQRVKSLADLVMVNRRALEGDFKSILIPGKAMKEGLWLGRNCRIHPNAKLEAPLLIGDHCNIQGGSSIGPGTVIGNQVIIDQGASVRDSLVLSNTYVGPLTEIKDALIKKNWMFQIPRMLHVHMGDDLILGDLEKRTLASKGERLLNLVLALFSLILVSPLLVTLFLYHLIFPSQKFFFSEKRLHTYGRMNLDGETTLQSFDLFLFRSGNRLIRKIPGLINVIRGDLNMVGVSPLTDEESRHLPEEWKDLRVNTPLGLFHLWELEVRDDLDWEEKMVMESYYAATRSTWWDLKIFFKALFAMMLG